MVLVAVALQESLGSALEKGQKATGCCCMIFAVVQRTERTGKDGRSSNLRVAVWVKEETSQ